MRKVFLCAALATVMALLCACSLPDNKTNTSITLTETGSVNETIVEEAGEDEYTAEDLQEYIGGELDKYNSGLETPAVTLESCRVEGGSVRLSLNYASCADYASFNQVVCFTGTLKEADDAGFSMDRYWLDPGGKEGENEIILERAKEWKVLIVSEAVNVKVPDKILYTSDNVKVTGRLTAVVETVMNTAAAGDGDEQQETAEREVHPLATVAERFAYVIYK